jgi:hypothetical protein
MQGSTRSRNKPMRQWRIYENASSMLDTGRQAGRCGNFPISAFQAAYPACDSGEAFFSLNTHGYIRPH